jgi:hypothetical protein
VDVDFIFPVAAIVVWGGGRMYSNYLKHQKEMALLRIQTGGSEDPSLHQEVAKLKQELAALRATSTEYDMSLQHVQDTLEQRVSHIETRLRSATVGNSADEQSLRAGRSTD